MFNLISQNIKSIVQRFFSTAGLILSKNNSSSYIVYSKEFGNLLGYKICVKSTADYWFNVSDKYKK
jgi:hypothetical protein